MNVLAKAQPESLGDSEIGYDSWVVFNINYIEFMSIR